MKTVKFILPLLCLLTLACNNVPVVDVTPADGGKDVKEDLIDANRLMAQSEESQIDSYVGRRGWTMQRLSSGIRVMESARDVKHEAVDYEDTVVFRYDMETLGGTTLYTAQCDTVIVGKLKPTRGVDAALRTLHTGSSAVVIVPSQEAYGVVGDGDRIGSRMILVYKIKEINKI